MNYNKNWLLKEPCEYVAGEIVITLCDPITLMPEEVLTLYVPDYSFVEIQETIKSKIHTYGDLMLQGLDVFANSNYANAMSKADFKEYLKENIDKRQLRFRMFDL